MLPVHIIIPKEIGIAKLSSVRNIFFDIASIIAATIDAIIPIK